jgi:ABC-type transporter Mla MlaB component
MALIAVIPSPLPAWFCEIPHGASRLAPSVLFDRAKESTMLRITTHDQGNSLCLQLDGKLAGPWVPILRDCWARELARPGGDAVHIDLRGVTFVDAAGKALLAEMLTHNARFQAGDCQMRAILAEIDPQAGECGGRLPRE